MDGQRDTSPPFAPLQRHRLGSRNKLGTPKSNARSELLRREARDESSAGNSVSCQSFAALTALRYAVTLQVCTHLKRRQDPHDRSFTNDKS